MLIWIYLGFAVFFFMGRAYEYDRLEDLRRRGTTYRPRKRWTQWLNPLARGSRR